MEPKGDVSAGDERGRTTVNVERGAFDYVDAFSFTYFSNATAPGGAPVRVVGFEVGSRSDWEFGANLEESCRFP